MAVVRELGNSGKLIHRTHEGDVSDQGPYHRTRPDITYLNDGGGGTTDFPVRYEERPMGSGMGDAGGHRPQLRRRRHAVGYVGYR